MKRQAFIDYLLGLGCKEVRKDKKGYSVFRNIINGEMSGVPVDDPLRAATVCRICKTLGVSPPEEAIIAKEVIDIAHQNHGKN